MGITSRQWAELEVLIMFLKLYQTSNLIGSAELSWQQLPSLSLLTSVHYQLSHQQPT